MNETVNQENSGTGAGSQEERTFTQAEMNAIIGDRLERERGKYADYEELKRKAEQFDAAQEAGKTELQKATEQVEKLQAQVTAFQKAETLRKIREDVSKATGVPASLLFGEDEETCKAQAEAIAAYTKTGTTTVIRDGGEPQHKPSGRATRDQFAEWFAKAQN